MQNSELGVCQNANHVIGDALGIELEQNFYKTAKEAGLSDEEAKNAFNSNMMATGLLSEFPAGFAKENSRKWLMSAFEAGDVVLHKPHMVSPKCHWHGPISGDI